MGETLTGPERPERNVPLLPHEGDRPAGRTANGDELHRACQRAMRWYLVGFGAVGLLTGFFAGLSESPVAVAVMPLIFATIGGSGGLYLASQKLGTVADAQRLRTVGYALLLFTVTCIAASCYGISVRKGARLASFVPQLRGEGERQAPLPISAKLSGQDLVDLAYLRAELTALQTPEAEQAKVLEHAARELVERTDRPSQLPPAGVLAEMTAGLAIIDKARERSAGPGDNKVPDAVIRGEYIVRGCAQVLDQWIKEKNPVILYPSVDYTDLLREVINAIDSMQTSQETMLWAAKAGVDYRAWFGMARRFQPVRRYSPAEQDNGRQRSEHNVALLQILLGREAGTAKEPDRPSIRP